MTKKTKKPKPKKVVSEPRYDWHEMIAFIESKYDIDVRDYAGKFAVGTMANNDIEYLDFWHWVVGEYDYINNPCEITFEVKVLLDDNRTPAWVKEILQRI